MPRMVLALLALCFSLLLAPGAHAAVSTTSSASASGTGVASALLDVPAGPDRFLAVGVSTVESATVTSVSFGAQVLTRLEASAQDSSRAEVWVLKAPNPGPSTVTVTASAGAPLVVGAAAFAGVDQALPVLAANSVNVNAGANSASLVLNGTVEADGMFGVLTVNDADNVFALNAVGSVDTVVPDRRWNLEQGTVAGAGATRRGNTGQNFALHAGINWYWNRIDPSRLMPQSSILVALRAAPAPPPDRVPVADAGGPYTVDEGSPLTLAGSGTDPEGATLTYAWDLNGDGHFEDAPGTTPTLTAAQLAALGLADGPVTRSIRLAVSDGVNVQLSAATTVTVRNVAPTATLNGATVDEGSPATVTFSDAADPSSDDETAGFSYEYDTDGDGTFEVKHNVPSVTIAAADGPATHKVTGAILDRDGGRREYTTTVLVRNVAPTLTVTGPEAVPSSGAVTLTVAATDVDPLTGTIDWGDGTVVPFTTGEVDHTYTGAGPRTVTVRVADKDGAEATATHTVTVAAVQGPHIRPVPSPTATPTPPAPPAPVAAGDVLGAAESNLKITRVRVTPRCIRTQGLRAITSAQRRIKVQFRASAAADVKFSLKRAQGRAGFAKCPPATGVAQKGGRKVPGVYSPFSGRTVKARRGLNTVTLAAVGRRGKALKPGTYLLTVAAGEVTARTRVWVLAG